MLDYLMKFFVLKVIKCQGRKGTLIHQLGRQSSEESHWLQRNETYHVLSDLCLASHDPAMKQCETRQTTQPPPRTQTSFNSSNFTDKNKAHFCVSCPSKAYLLHWQSFWVIAHFDLFHVASSKVNTGHTHNRFSVTGPGLWQTINIRSKNLS